MHTDGIAGGRAREDDTVDGKSSVMETNRLLESVINDHEQMD